MTELELKYGCNPNQKPSKIFMKNGKELPIKIHSGRPGYINFLDAFNGMIEKHLCKLIIGPLYIEEFILSSSRKNRKNFFFTLIS